MDTDLQQYTVAEVTKGFVYNELEGKVVTGALRTGLSFV